MFQTTLFDDERVEHHHIVNVASVPQRSPFRYPGGKTWLVPHVRRWLNPGSGVLKQGENGRGNLSRWYPETLKRRILDILTIREPISFLQGYGPELMRQNTHCSGAVFFFNRPYISS